MIWSVAGGILLAMIPLALIGAGIMFMDDQSRRGDEVGGAWVLIGIGVVIGAAIIWKAFIP